MDKIARFVNIHVPVTSCTFRCHYCFITTHRLFSAELPQFKYTPQQFRAGLSRERMGGIASLNFCGGGETLLPPEMPVYFKELLDEGHFVSIVTNGTVFRAFDEIAKFPTEFFERMFFKFSYHHFELEKRNLSRRYFDNVKRMRDLGCSFTLEITPNDELIPRIGEVKEICMREVGAWPHVTVARDERVMGKLPILTNLSRQDFIRTWSTFDSELFRLKMSVFERRLPSFCYAGDWSFYLNMGTGIMTQCYCSFLSQDIIADPSRPIRYLPIGHHCTLPHCFNAHVFVPYGILPDAADSYYDLERNRVCADGSEWLKPRFKAFMHQRLCDNRTPYSVCNRWMVDAEMFVRKRKRKLGTFKWKLVSALKKIRNLNH